MSDKQVNFVINVTGNAQENITQISQGIQNATTKVSNFTNTMAKIRDVGLAFEFVNRAVSRISSTLSSYEDLSYAQVEAETKLAQVMRTTIGASDAEIQSIKELTAAQQRLGAIGRRL